MRAILARLDIRLIIYYFLQAVAVLEKKQPLRSSECGVKPFVILDSSLLLARSRSLIYHITAHYDTLRTTGGFQLFSVGGRERRMHKRLYISTQR